MRTGKLHVIAMCGLAFAGKSTAARQIASMLDYDLIVLDRINDDRGLDGSKGLTVEQWEQTSLIAMQQLRSALTAGRSAVVDDTHSHRFLRDRCKAVALEFSAAFEIVWLDTPPDVVDRRRWANRLNPVRADLAEPIFEAHRASFEFPTADESVAIVRSSADLDGFIREATAVSSHPAGFSPGERTPI